MHSETLMTLFEKMIIQMMWCMEHLLFKAILYDLLSTLSIICFKALDKNAVKSLLKSGVNSFCVFL